MSIQLPKLILGLQKGFIIAAIFFSSPLFAQKVAVVNLDSLYRIMPSVQEAQKTARDYLKQLEDEVAKMQEEFNRKAEEYVRDSATFSAVIKETKIKELTDLRQRITDFQVKAQQDYRNKENELFTPVSDAVRAAVRKVATAKGYTVVLDSGAGQVLYSSESVEIFNDVKKELGLK